MKKILVVEDDLSYLKLLVSQLTAKGYTVLEARNGKKGLAVALKEKPDIILLDIRMPVMDGMAMLDLLRKDAYGKTAKVIVLTNLEPDDAIVSKVVDDHPTYYFVKSDTNLDDLLDKITEVLSE